MIFISIIISLLLLKLYPEYKIYILLFLLLSFILSRRTEGLNEIIINEDWDQHVLSSDNTDNAEDPTKIKISSDPVRNCYYKLSPDPEAPCLPFPSDPNNFNQDKDERFASPENRKPLFFDFLPIWGDSAPYDVENKTISIQKKRDGNDYKPSHVLSPINVIQLGYSESDKFTNTDNIAPSGITENNEKISYRSLTERERRSKIIRDTKNNTGGKIDVYKGWSGSNNGKIKIENGAEEQTVDKFLNGINVNNIINRETFNSLNNMHDLDDTWYTDLIKIYANNYGSTGYFLDNLNSPEEYTNTVDQFDAPFMDIWNNGDWISKDGITEADFPQDTPLKIIGITEKFKDIRLTDSTVENLYSYIMKFKINMDTGKYEIREGKEDVEIPQKDRRFVLDMIRIADRGTNSEVNNIRYEVFQIIERIMRSNSINNIGFGKWNPTETGYNTIEYPLVGSGNIHSVYADSTCTSEIDNYKYFFDPSPPPKDDATNKYALLCSDSNKKVTYTPNDYELGDKLEEECPSNVLQNDENFNRGLYVKCFPGDK